MLRIPSDGNGIVKLIGIDPGTKLPGICVMSYDVPNKKIVRIAAHCFNLERLARRSIHSEYQNPRFLQLQALRHILKDMFRSELPFKIASEYPYINMQRPGAVIPLAECLFMIEQEVHAYNPYLCLERIAPSNVKQAVGVSGDSGEKHAMTEAIKQIPEIVDVLVNDINTLDNNAVDSIAVAYCALKRELDHDYPG
jgi:Holliday junction resolvasome RuvABC endonuclease subunit